MGGGGGGAVWGTGTGVPVWAFTPEMQAMPRTPAAPCHSFSWRNKWHLPSFLPHFNAAWPAPARESSQGFGRHEILVKRVNSNETVNKIESC